MKINVTVQFQCGCGFLVRKLNQKELEVIYNDRTKEKIRNAPGMASKLAVQHAEATEHSLTVTGTVKPAA